MQTRNPNAALAATPELIKFTTTGESINVSQKCRGLYLGTKKNYYWLSFSFDHSLCFNNNYNYGTSSMFHHSFIFK